MTATKKVAKKKTTKKHSDIVKLDKQSKLLPCKLTDEELLKYGSELGTVNQDISEEKDREKSIKQELTSRMTALEAKRSELSTKITRKEEFRHVDVSPMRDFKNGIYVEIRQDTLAKINERKLRAEEYQTDIERK